MTGTEDITDKKLNPRGSYQHPDQVLADPKLTREQKIEILREWHYDAIRLQESDGENMTGGEPDLLRAVSRALLSLDVSPAVEGDPNAPKPTQWWEKPVRYVTQALRGKSADQEKPK